MLCERGDVVLVSLDPAVGSAQGKHRPCVLVSNDAAHAAAEITGAGMVAVVPLTSRAERILPFQARVDPSHRNGLTLVSKAQAEQVRSVSARRIVRRLGALDRATMAAIDDALRVHLAL